MLTNNNKRLVNFEVLRCFLMLMIVYIHFFTHGEKFANLNTDACFHLSSCFGFTNYIISQLIATIARTSVNLFVFITGYFLIESHTFHFQKILKLWIPTVFYSFSFATISYYFSGGTIGFRELLKSLVPIKSSEYWFVTDYFALILLAPFLAKMASGLSKKSYLIGLAFLAFLMLDLCRFPYGFTYKNAHGTSLFFFVLLFFTGGYFKKYKELIPVHKLHLKGNRQLLLFTFMMVSVYGMFGKIDFSTAKAVVGQIPYHSFTYVLSVVFFQYFLSIRVKRNIFTKVCCILSPFTFSVYLIHDNLYVRNLLWHDFLHLEKILDKPYYLLFLLLVPIFIFFLGVLIEFLRILSFEQLGINKILSKFKYSVTLW